MKKTWLIVLAFVGVFLAGGVAGGFIGARTVRTVIQRRAMEQFTRHHFKRVADQLQLTQEQRARIREIVRDAGEKVQEQRRGTLRILDQMEADVRSQLTEEQKPKFDELRSKMRDNERRWHRWIREQRSRHGEAGGESLRDGRDAKERDRDERSDVPRDPPDDGPPPQEPGAGGKPD